ncbi:unnamed protein product, partial [Dibothriocephalus latus]
MAFLNEELLRIRDHVERKNLLNAIPFAQRPNQIPSTVNSTTTTCGGAYGGAGAPFESPYLENGRCCWPGCQHTNTSASSCSSPAALAT